MNAFPLTINQQIFRTCWKKSHQNELYSGILEEGRKGSEQLFEYYFQFQNLFQLSPTAPFISVIQLIPHFISYKLSEKMWNFQERVIKLATGTVSLITVYIF